MSATQLGWKHSDRRSAARYDLPVPITAQRVSDQPANPVAGMIRNISIRGVYFTTDQELTLDCELDLTFVLPEVMTQGPEVLVRARGRVMRVETEGSTQHVGVAAVIERYEIVRAKASPY
jgi:PilZ domain